MIREPQWRATWQGCRGQFEGGPAPLPPIRRAAGATFEAGVMASRVGSACLSTPPLMRGSAHGSRCSARRTATTSSNPGGSAWTSLSTSPSGSILMSDLASSTWAADRGPRPPPVGDHRHESPRRRPPRGRHRHRDAAARDHGLDDRADRLSTLQKFPFAQALEVVIANAAKPKEAATPSRSTRRTARRQARPRRR
jgi:hypothetical protein